ncbi:hypothetical protein ABZ465_09700 [Streptomyces griseoincarnatus]
MAESARRDLPTLTNSAERLLAGLDLSRERLVVRRPGKRHIIHLDELTYRCASAWLS